MGEREGKGRKEKEENIYFVQKKNRKRCERFQLRGGNEFYN